jgi:hypothetical protein
LTSSIHPLSSRDRVGYYRGMTAEAVARAQTTDDPVQKARHVDNAIRWLALAYEAENMEARLARLPPPPSAMYMAEETNQRSLP